jgi:hypothetical protein
MALTMRDQFIPDLTFPSVEYGRTQMRWDLRPLLYKGGAAANVRQVFNLIGSGKLGHPIDTRIDLVTRIHAELTARLVAGGAQSSVCNFIANIRTHFINTYAAKS